MFRRVDLYKIPHISFLEKNTFQYKDIRITINLGRQCVAFWLQRNEKKGWVEGRLYPLLILIKICWNILASVRGKRSRHCFYEMEWEFLKWQSAKEGKIGKNKSQESMQTRRADVNFTRQTKGRAVFTNISWSNKRRERNKRKVTSFNSLISPQHECGSTNNWRQNNELGKAVSRNTRSFSGSASQEQKSIVEPWSLWFVSGGK